jgi:hypothetical protein
MLVTLAVPQAQDEPQTAARAGPVLAYRLVAAPRRTDATLIASSTWPGMVMKSGTTSSGWRPIAPPSAPTVPNPTPCFAAL